MLKASKIDFTLIETSQRILNKIWHLEPIFSPFYGISPPTTFLNDFCFKDYCVKSVIFKNEVEVSNY